MTGSQLTHNDYTVAWICPLAVELVAAMEMLDKTHPRLTQPVTDPNSYALGSIDGHNVVIAGLPDGSNCSAAMVVSYMRTTFSKLRYGLLVGIGGGVPTRTDAGPIQLGHVVVSKPIGQHSGALQYDYGNAVAGDFRQTGYIAPPPGVLLSATSMLEAARMRARKDPLQAHLKRIDTSIRGLRKYRYPGADEDRLYEATYVHLDKRLSCQKSGCDASRRVYRPVDNAEDTPQWIVVHRGTIASGELVMRDGVLRDRLAKKHGVLCFEMEAAGALKDLPCLVIRGVSDYSDSHKNDKWHGYAAAVAAAYARELIYHMPTK